MEFLSAAHITKQGPVTPEEWECLTRSERAVYVEALLEAVIVQPATKRGNRFDPERLVYVWRESVAPRR